MGGKCKVKGDINLKLVNVNKCKTMTWGALEIRRGRKTRILEVWKPRLSAAPCAPARSQDSERKNMELGHIRARPPSLQRAQVGEKNKNGASSPTLSLLSLSSCFFLSLELSLSFFPQRFITYGIFTIYYHCLSLPPS